MGRDFDLFVLGAGSGGVRASRLAAGQGVRVAVAEDDRLGGTCVNLGCIPKKLFVLASHYSEDFEDASGYGWSVGPSSFDWPTLIAHKDEEIARLNGVYQRLLDGAGVTRISGRARIVDAHTVEVGERHYTAEHLLVAVGSWPHLPAIPGIEHTISSNEAFALEQLPKRAAIVGGGYIGVEFAGIFNGLGVETHQIYRGPLFLRGFDDDLRKTLAEEMPKKGVSLRFETDVTEIRREDDGLHLALNDGSHLVVDEVLYATGRIPKTKDLGLERAGVALGKIGEILVDPYSQTNVPSIWALGDVTDRMNLTPVALAEAVAFVRTVFGGEPTRPDHTNVATAVFSQPPIGTVGLTETEARAQLGEIDVYRSSFRPIKHTLTGRDEMTAMKLLVDPKSDRVVGAHMIGADAPEILQGIGIAVKLGATKAQFDATIGIHPTAAEEFVTMREKVQEE
ncbi:MAG: glutathione-disulfide reductase [bacterium]|nr:glutathione-disulfide reductase [bacterium]MCP5070286.1 glutathione-disulfide reductase [bacterium]